MVGKRASLTIAVPKNESLHKNRYVLAVACLLFFLLCFQAARAQDSTVGAYLCDTTTGPVLTISQPISDTVVNTPNITLSGTVENATQIDIYVNESYSHSIALGFDGGLSTTVGLMQGTNTIRVEASFSCNNTSAQTQIVVDYVPDVIPSTPNNTTSSVNDGAKMESLPPDYNAPRSLDDQSIVEEIKDKLGLNGTDDAADTAFERRESYTEVAGNWLLVSSAVFLAVGASWAPLYTLRLSRLIEPRLHTKLTPHAHRLVRFVTMFLAAVLMGVFFVS